MSDGDQKCPTQVRVTMHARRIFACCGLAGFEFLITGAATSDPYDPFSPFHLFIVTRDATPAAEQMHIASMRMRPALAQHRAHLVRKGRVSIL